MLPVYVFAAILGGGLILAGMLGSKGAPTAGSALDGDWHVTGKDIGWNKVFSLRTIAYALGAFGLAGSGLTWIAAPAFLTLMLAIGMGVFGGMVASAMFGWLRRNEFGFGESSQSYIGGLGRAEIRIPDGGRGRIELVHRGRAFTLPAVSRRGTIDRLEPVIIIDVVDGVAMVERAPQELDS